MVAAAKTANRGPTASSSELHRVIGWKDAFWVASGVPALVLFLDRRHRRYGRHTVRPSVDALRPVRLHSSLHLCRDRRPVPEQIGRRLGVWRGGLGSLFQVHRAAVGVVQLARLDAGAGDRLRHRRRLHPQRPVPARGGDQDLGNPAARSRLPEGRAETPAQLDLLHRCDSDRSSPSPSSIAAFSQRRRCRLSSAWRCYCRS